jgi:non-specific serine/threonine protein kinase/serine/threonine-protein kinase
LRLAEREGFFLRHCAGDDELRTELEELLAQDDQGTKDFLQSPLVAEDTATGVESVDRSGSQALPESIGRYRLIEKIGEGGMGEVFLAEQQSPVRREVALKVVKPGMDTVEIVERFERERQTLALMAHPGIARIFDGGTTAGGRPYFVMEHVTGCSILEYCDRERLPIRERLGLFTKVCLAVQHAHQKGVIHRDLKPTNVLVTERDGKPEPKVIDFGIARSLGEDDGQTRATEVVGTRHYMSPEQARLSDAQLDTRTDVYSLGVLLFELLTGVLPHDPSQLRGKSQAEIQLALARSEPPTPSARVRHLDGDTHRSMATLRRADARTFGRELSGDLDWIVLKAMAKEPERRYSSASELASDVQRYIEYHPVIAGPPDWRYRTSKFVRRHRFGTLFAAFIVAVVLVGMIGTTVGMIEYQAKAEEARDNAEDAGRAEQEAVFERAEAERARVAAERRAHQARSVTDFLVDTISLADPEVARDPNLTLRTMLDRAGQRVGPALQDFPESEATLRGAIGRAFQSIDRLDLAEQHLQRALALQERLPGASLGDRYQTARRLARVYEDTNLRDTNGAVQRTWELGLELIEKRDPRLAGSLLSLFEHEHTSPRPLGERLAELERTLEESVPMGDPLRVVAADVLEFLGSDLVGADNDESGTLLEAAVRIRRAQLDPRDLDLARSIGILVHALVVSGRAVEAEPLAREALAIHEGSLPDTHPRIADARSMLGESLSLQGRLEEAEPLLIEGQRAILEARSPSTRIGIDSTLRLVEHFERADRPNAADQNRSVLAHGLAFAQNPPWHPRPRAAAFGPERAHLSEALERCADSMFEFHMSDVPSEAVTRQLRREVDEVLRLRRELLTDDDARSVIVVRVLADGAHALVDEAPMLHRRICDEALEVLGPFHTELAEVIGDVWRELAYAASMAGEPGRANEAQRAALDLLRDIYGRTSFEALHVEAELLELGLAEGLGQALEDELLETWQTCALERGYGHEATLLALGNLALLARATERPAVAERCIALHLDPRNARQTSPAVLDDLVWMAVSSARFRPELCEKAWETSEQIVAQDPEKSSAWSTLALARYRTGRFEAALRAVERIDELTGSLDAEDVATRALTQHALGRHAEAAVSLEQAEALERESVFNMPLVLEATATISP